MNLEYNDNKTVNPGRKNGCIILRSEINLLIRANDLQFCHGWGREGERDYDRTKYPKMS